MYNTMDHARHLGITRAITLKEPWASAVAFRGKRIENRTWAPPSTIQGEMIAIHSGAAFDTDAETFMKARCLPVPSDGFMHGHVIARARVIGVIHPLDAYSKHKIEWYVSDFEDRPAINVNWHVSDHYGWLLDEVGVFDDPIPASGSQGIWMLEKGVR